MELVLPGAGEIQRRTPGTRLFLPRVNSNGHHFSDTCQHHLSHRLSKSTRDGVPYMGWPVPFVEGENSYKDSLSQVAYCTGSTSLTCLPFVFLGK